MVIITMEIHGVNKDTTQITNNSSWRPARIKSIRSETPTVKTFSFEMPEIVRHTAGQHYEIRLTAPNGYQAARLYSAASFSNTPSTNLELTIALMPDGEVSPYMFNQVKEGDVIEVRGPLGKFFVWNQEIQQPIILIAGGSGVVPMRCILQAHKQNLAAPPIKLLYSARSYSNIIYRDELINDDRVTITLTNDFTNWSGHRGRINPKLFTANLDDSYDNPLCFVCGSNNFVETMIELALGTEKVTTSNIKAERFGG